ncbi:hypothetical protein Q9Q94_09445 [Uliginosibacterium sp. 31-16]|uniref:hypothetical protein n=1 Tax=Uliginosibacterium sp. 31-16 TaxID=3068315 RepID=UPI00273EF738|nr:hypothetical protein [Uliginosibacterium sp. 31-16]MDP5239755.1 hypothetical protein [Uliginosibacterium sp. 31-16]
MRSILHAILLSTLLATSPLLQAASKPGQFGKRLVASFEIPADEIDAIRQAKTSRRAPNTSALESAFGNEVLEWAGTEQYFMMIDNPYTLVVRLSGKARRDGNAASMWLGGFAFVDGKGEEKSVLNPVTGLSQPDARGGESFTLVSSAKPVSVAENRRMTPVLTLNRIDNMEVESVSVEIWSGMAETSFTKTFLGAPWMFGGLFMLGLWWFWFKRH